MQSDIMYEKKAFKNRFYDVLSGQYLQFHLVWLSFCLHPGPLVSTNTWKARRNDWVAFNHIGFSGGGWGASTLLLQQPQKAGKAIPPEDTLGTHGILAKLGQEKKKSPKAEPCFCLPSTSL